MLTRKVIQGAGRTHRVLLRTEDFLCLRPHHSLHAAVSNINITFPSSAILPGGFTEMPCGCATLSIKRDSGGIRAELSGPTTRPCVIGGQADQLDLLITVEFRPVGLYALTGIPQSEITDSVLPFDAVDPVLCKRLCETALRAQRLDDLVIGLDTLLLQSMAIAYHPQLMLALGSIASCAGRIDVKRLAADVHYSERQLSRIFKQHVGVSTKSLSQIIRINRAFHLLKKREGNVALVSDLLGFHDPSHFVRDFRSVCGITPQAFCSNMSDFYINPTKF